MSKTSIVFYCKDCDSLFFAVVNEPDMLKDCAKDIQDYLKAGHRMAEVPHDTVRSEFRGCECEPEPEALQLAFVI